MSSRIALERGYCLACQADFTPAIQINHAPICPRCHGEAFFVVAVIDIGAFEAGEGRVAVPVTPPLCPMGGNPTTKALVFYTGVEGC